MTEQTDAAEVGVLADLIAKAHPFWSDKARGLHVCIAKDILASDWLAAREAAAEARGAERALREAAEDVFRAASTSGGSPVFRGEIADWLRARATGLTRDPSCNRRPHYGEPCDCEARLAQVVTHTRTSTGGYGPDFCAECSEAISEWVAWPCDAARAAQVAPSRVPGEGA